MKHYEKQYFELRDKIWEYAKLLRDDKKGWRDINSFGVYMTVLDMINALDVQLVEEGKDEKSTNNS